MPNPWGEDLLIAKDHTEEPRRRRRGPSFGPVSRGGKSADWARQNARRILNMDRLEWYLREYGRPPTYDELIALREMRKLK